MNMLLIVGVLLLISGVVHAWVEYFCPIKRGPNK